MAVISKSVIVASAIAVSTAARADDTDLGTGQCKNANDCTSLWGKDYACISVNVGDKRSVTRASMCVPTKSEHGVCSGLDSGLCPTFSSLPQQTLNRIQSVCAFFPPQDGNQCVNKSIEDQGGKLVDCKLWTPQLDGKDLATTNGIYGCVDAQLYQSDNDYSDVYGEKYGSQIIQEQLKACAGEKGRMCSGAGTCVPTSDLSMNYTCACNTGYSGQNCSIVESNSCDIGGACQSGQCVDTPKGRQCKCEEGTTGDQCSKCMEGANACSGSGKCSNGTCTCEEGYGGTFCQTALPVPEPTGTESGSSDAVISSPTIVAVGVVVASFAAAFL